jgi:hypothetical protein
MPVQGKGVGNHKLADGRNEVRLLVWAIIRLIFLRLTNAWVVCIVNEDRYSRVGSEAVNTNVKVITDKNINRAVLLLADSVFIYR